MTSLAINGFTDEETHDIGHHDLSRFRLLAEQTGHDDRGQQGSEMGDTCVCVFAQVGRAVVEVHSTEGVFDPAKRSTFVQTAIDKVKATL